VSFSWLRFWLGVLGRLLNRTSRWMCDWLRLFMRTGGATVTEVVYLSRAERPARVGLLDGLPLLHEGRLGWWWFAVVDERTGLVDRTRLRLWLTGL
jgi:hypothetical protein